YGGSSKPEARRPTPEARSQPLRLPLDRPNIIDRSVIGQLTHSFIALPEGVSHRKHRDSRDVVPENRSFTGIDRHFAVSFDVMRYSEMPIAPLLRRYSRHQVAAIYVAIARQAL